jgi:hypothetical protein
MKIQDQFKSIWKQSNSSQNFAYFVGIKNFRLCQLYILKAAHLAPIEIHHFNHIKVWSYTSLEEREELLTKQTSFQMFQYKLHYFYQCHQLWFFYFKEFTKFGFLSQFGFSLQGDTWLKLHTQMLVSILIFSRTPIACKRKFNAIYK